MTLSFSHAAARGRHLASQAVHLPRAVALAWAAARGWTLAWFLVLVLQGLLPVALVYLTRALVDGTVNATRAAAGGWAVFLPVLTLGAAMAAVMLLAELMRGAMAWLRAAQSERVGDHIRSLVHAKAVEVDLAYYERPDYYDRLHRATTESAARAVALLESMGSLFRSGLTLAAMMGVLLPYAWWLPAALLVSTLPAFYVVLHYAARHHAWWISATPAQRKVWYYDWLLTTPEPAAELRQLRLGAHFREAYQELRGRLRGEKLLLERSQALAGFLAGAAGLALAALPLAWMLWRVVGGTFTLGDLALFFQAFNQGQGMMRTLLQNLADLYRNSLFLGNLFEFLAIEPAMPVPAEPAPFPVSLERGVRFEDVSFQYPGETRRVLERFNLDLPAGRITAVVGRNGAGKSTLAKLLCRLYDPDAGRVLVDGVELKDFDLAELRTQVAVLFQAPVRYQASVLDNIAFGRWADRPVREEIVEAARAAGAEEMIERLPEGYDSLLGRWIAEGHELSVGEWRRLALARVFLRGAPLVILDEPTSAMDAWAESEWLDRLAQRAAGQTVLLITHRFTTARRADVIHVMERGRIVESGSHQELAAGSGPYARSWNGQMGGTTNSTK